jgi:peroxiredoxin
MRFLLLVLAAAGLLAQAPSLSGRRAPSFSLPDPTLKQHDILDYRGRWLLIEFMQTSCPHCKALSKTLDAFKKRFAGKVDVLSVVISPPENQQTAAAYTRETGITFPILFDMGQVASNYFKATPQNPSFDVPHLFAINPNGMIVRDWGHEAAENAGLVKELEQLVSGGALAK